MNFAIFQLLHIFQDSSDFLIFAFMYVVILVYEQFMDAHNTPIVFFKVTGWGIFIMLHQFH